MMTYMRSMSAALAGSGAVITAAAAAMAGRLMSRVELERSSECYRRVVNRLTDLLASKQEATDQRPASDDRAAGERAPPCRESQRQ